MVHLLVEEMERYAEMHSVPIIFYEGLEFISTYVKDNNVKSILEVGTAIAYSSINFALIDEDIHIDTIERNQEMYQQAVSNVSKAGLAKRIDIHFIDAMEFKTTKQYDLIFIDAAKSQYQTFFELFEHSLSKNGAIICDNLDFHGLVKNPQLTTNRNTRQLVGKIARFVDFLKNNQNYHTQFYEIGDGISVSKKVEK